MVASFHRLDLPQRGITTFSGLKSLSELNFVIMDFSHNLITTFENFSSHPYLTELDLQGNRIESFLGLTKQRSLTTLKLSGNPIAQHPCYRIMALLVVGYSIVEIDGIAITPEERMAAKRLDYSAALATSYGWLLDLYPRPREAYEDIIAAYKERRKARPRDDGPVVTVLDGLEAQRAQASKTLVGPLNDQPESRQLVSVPPPSSQTSEEVVERLCHRVAELEHQLKQAQEVLQTRLHNPQVPILGPSGMLWESSPLQPLRESELCHASTITFLEGITARSNTGGDTCEPRRVVLQLNKDVLSVLSFMTRSIMLELPLRRLEMQHMPPKSLMVHDPYGTVLELTFDTRDVLSGVYKAFSLMTGKPLVQLSWGTDEPSNGVCSPTQGQTNVTRTSERSGRVYCAPSLETLTHLSDREPERQPSIMEASPEGNLSLACLEPVHDAGTADNIPDVPPLPSLSEKLVAQQVSDPTPPCHSVTAEENGGSSVRTHEPGIEADGKTSPRPSHPLRASRAPSDRQSDRTATTRHASVASGCVAKDASSHTRASGLPERSHPPRRTSSRAASCRRKSWDLPPPVPRRHSSSAHRSEAAQRDSQRTSTRNRAVVPSPCTEGEPLVSKSSHKTSRTKATTESTPRRRITPSGRSSAQAAPPMATPPAVHLSASGCSSIAFKEHETSPGSSAVKSVSNWRDRLSDLKIVSDTDDA